MLIVDVAETQIRDLSQCSLNFKRFKILIEILYLFRRNIWGIEKPV